MSMEVISGAMSAVGFAGGVADTRTKDPHDPGDVRNVRCKQLVAVGVSFVFAAYIAKQQNSAKPYLWWIASIGAIVLLYEWALRDETDVG